jgi:hypothetical protein
MWLKWKHPRSREPDTRAAIHGALERFEPIDLSFRLTAAPRLRDGVFRFTAEMDPRSGTA